MKYILSSIFLSLICFFCHSQDPQKDEELVNHLKKNHIQLIVMRHGEALHNLSHLMCSSRSPGVYLTENGILQIQNSADHLNHEEINQIYVSPVYRTLQTAQIVTMKLKIPHQKIFVEEDLREQFVGIFENHTYEEYEAYFSNHTEVFISGAPEGESGKELFLRTQRLLWKIAHNHTCETILLITHAYNGCQIHKCLTGEYGEYLDRGGYRKYNFN